MKPQLIGLPTFVLLLLLHRLHCEVLPLLPVNLAADYRGRGTRRVEVMKWGGDNLYLRD